MQELAAVTAAYNALFELEAASMSTILAFGARACAHSISRDSSSSQPELQALDGAEHGDAQNDPFPH
jgi:hypothetical protein